MKEALRFNFSHLFKGFLWNVVAAGDEPILLLEIRDAVNKVVSFSALNVATNVFLWTDKTFDERWWINASAIRSGKVIFTVYMDTNNPDKKGIVTCSLADLKMVWWNNDFSISEIGQDHVVGFSSRFGQKMLTLDVTNGAEVNSPFEPAYTSTTLRKPVQYSEDMEYFATVKSFLNERLNLYPVSALEYLEEKGLIFISWYQQTDSLANYLLVLNNDGEVVFQETLQEKAQGVGLDTFFVLGSDLFFVRNKVELVSYKII